MEVVSTDPLIGALQCLHHRPTRPSTTTTVVLDGRRTLFDFFRRGNSPRSTSSNPVLDEFMKKKPTKENPGITRGDLASSSIFDTDRKIQEREQAEEEQAGDVRNPATMAAVVDPRPRNRERWQRKMVIREVRKGGRLSRVQFIKRTEREHKSRSHNMKTSIKKLGPLARQIAGKNIDDAITQMRFSKKKVAIDVLKYLEYARDRAIVERGMGLGGVQSQDDMEAGVFDISASETAQPTNTVQIRLKDGKKKEVTDPSRIYIDQAWVGRGPFGQLPDYRARGRLFIMRTPWTSMSVILKEEATRIREHNEREAKRERQRLAKVWVPLPDRPISGQRQWFSW